MRKIPYLFFVAVLLLSACRKEETCATYSKDTKVKKTKQFTSDEASI
ncbi:MAG: hypothetical protein J7604_22540 [Sporocytophaga sp.]|nr:MULTISPECIES: hypothetical protein [Sporocytophaga]MBO9703010.1 hypothetical protein [Sporocytophaga sp.]